MRRLAERAYFVCCQGVAWLLRSARYLKVRPEDRAGEPMIRKDRLFYAPLLVWLSGPVVGLLGGGVRVLPQRDWLERERSIYRALDRRSIRLDEGGTLLLPRLQGETLAALLDKPGLVESDRASAIRLAALALARLHHLGFTHADAMAENVMIDLETGSASWFDFETVHDPTRSLTWQHADDVRALVSSCVARTDDATCAVTVHLILDAYGDADVERVLAASFTSAFRRALAFHLSQAELSFAADRQIAQILDQRRR